jgi:hypothetical protein
VLAASALMKPAAQLVHPVLPDPEEYSPASQFAQEELAGEEE